MAHEIEFQAAAARLQQSLDDFRMDWLVLEATAGARQVQPFFDQRKNSSAK